MWTVDFHRTDITDLEDCAIKETAVLSCNVIHIGNYSFEPKDSVILTEKGLRIIAPLPNNPQESCALHIHKVEVVKVIAHFSNTTESMLCLYTARECVKYMKNSLQLNDPAQCADPIAYFAPNGPYQMRKVILQLESITDEARQLITSMWDFFDEISFEDAQDLLHRAAEANRQMPSKTNDETAAAPLQLNPNEIRQLLIYPPGKGGISINTEDYMCLATDQYLNDIIIDFYLKWVHNNVVPPSQRQQTFIFSSFFYKRLTTLSRHHHNQYHDKDVKQTAAQKRHARVQNWTKNVNLFEKDFIIIPINEQSHWFLAIICFPQLMGPVTFDTNIPVEPQLLKRQRGKRMALQIGNTTITPLSKRDSNSASSHSDVAGSAGADEDSERDEAEAEESDLASDESSMDSNAEYNNSNTAAANAANAESIAAVAATAVTNNTNSHGGAATGAGHSNHFYQPVKQPLILIFDSLAGASRSRVVATLRDYLSCEYKLKMPDFEPRVYNKDNMPGHCVKVPQQNNFTDCGLYLLQYVEQFFIEPIRDYRLPIRQLNSWFDTLTVTRKREDISLLLQQLIDEKNGPGVQKYALPEIPFPTLNGQLVQSPEGRKSQFDDAEMEEQTVEEEETSAGTNCETELSADEVSGSGGSISGSGSTNSKTSTSSTTTKGTTPSALVPTQGRKIVVKRRMPLSSASSDTTSPTANSPITVAGAGSQSPNAAATVTASPTTTATSTHVAHISRTVGTVKLRKVE